MFTIVTLLYWTSMYIYVPTLSPYLSDLGYSLPFIGIVLGSYGLVQMLVRFPLGVLSDRLGKRKPFILLGFVSAGGSCMLFLLPDLWIWPLAGRLLAGVCASTWVAFTVMYAAFFAHGEAGKAMGNISVMTVSGQMAGMLLSGWLTDDFSPKAPFVVGIAAAVIGLALSLFLRESHTSLDEGKRMSLDRVGKVVRNSTLLRVSMLSILAHGVLFITMFGFTPLKGAELGASGIELTLLVFAFMLPHATASFLTGSRFAPVFGPWKVIAAGFILSGICTGSMLFIDRLPLLYLSQAFNGFAQGLHLPLLLGLAIRDVQERGRATAMGLYQAIYAIGMFSGPFLAGWLNEEWGLGSGFVFGALLTLIATSLVWRWSIADKRKSDGRMDHNGNAGLRKSEG